MATKADAARPASAIEPADRALIASLALLRALDETELFEFELGFPPIEVWERSFEDPSSDDGFRMLEAIHCRLMYSQKRLNELKDRLFADEKNEWINELHKTVSGWVTDRDKLDAWFRSEDGSIEDDQSALAKLSMEELNDLLREIGGTCPFRKALDDEERDSAETSAEGNRDPSSAPSPTTAMPPSLPTYGQLDKDTRIRLFSALCRWACMNNSNVNAALHEQTDDVLAIARYAPLGWDKKGHTYYWFPDVAPYRIFKESYPDPPKKPKDQPKKKEEPTKQKKRMVKAESEDDEEDDKDEKASKKVVKGKSGDKEQKKSAKTGLNALEGQKKKGSRDASPSQKKSKQSNSKTTTPTKAKVGTSKVKPTPTRVLPTRASPLRASSAKVAAKKKDSYNDEEERSQSDSDDDEEEESSSDSSSGSPLAPNKAKQEAMPNFTSSGRVIRKPLSAAEEFEQQKKADAKKLLSKRVPAHESKSPNASKSKSTSKKLKSSKGESSDNKRSKGKSVNEPPVKKQKQGVDALKEPPNKKQKLAADVAKEKPKEKPKAPDIIKSKGKVPPRETVTHYLRDVEDSSETIFWECLCKDWESLQALASKLEKEKENPVLLQAMKHVLTWADVIGKEQVEVFKEAQEERSKAIEKYNLQVAYEALEQDRHAFDNAHGSVTFNVMGINLRRSGRVKKLTEAAHMSKQFEEMEEVEDPKDARSLSARDAKFLLPSSGTRRSSRLARQDDEEDEGEDAEEEEEEEEEEAEKWQCSKCTFGNALTAKHCGMCGERRPPMKYVRGTSPTSMDSGLAEPDRSWNGHSVVVPSGPSSSLPEPKQTEFNGHRVIWSCASCTFENDEDSHVCGACQRERFAPINSVPVASIMEATPLEEEQTTIAPLLSASTRSDKETGSQGSNVHESTIVPYGEAADKDILAAEAASGPEAADARVRLAAEVTCNMEAPARVIAAEVASSPVPQEASM